MAPFSLILSFSRWGEGTAFGYHSKICLVIVLKSVVGVRIIDWPGDIPMALAGDAFYPGGWKPPAPRQAIRLRQGYGATGET